MVNGKNITLVIIFILATLQFINYVKSYASGKVVSSLPFFESEFIQALRAKDADTPLRPIDRSFLLAILTTCTHLKYLGILW